MLFGYNTNGLAFHRPEDAIELLAEIGYGAIAITVDQVWLDPFDRGNPACVPPNLHDRLARMRELLDRHNLESVIETGARFYLDPRVKHEPTLMSAPADQRWVRIEFLKRCVDVADGLGSLAVSFWSGALRDGVDEAAAFERLAAGCREIIDYAGTKNVRLAFEPEPGMFIERLDQFATLLERVDAPHFGLTLDVGHLQCVEEPPIARYVREWGGRIFNVHIEDMVRGVHEHLRFGEGQIDFPPVLAALEEVGYTAPVHVELSRHSHMAPQVMRESLAFLQQMSR